MFYARFLLLCLLVTSPLAAGPDFDDDDEFDVLNTPPLPRLRSQNGSEKSHEVNVAMIKFRYHEGYDRGLDYCLHHDQSTSYKNGREVRTTLSDFFRLLAQEEEGQQAVLIYLSIWDDDLDFDQVDPQINISPWNERIALTAAYLMGYGKALGMRWSE